MTMLRHVDLCSGIGGFALGFQWAELSKTIMFCDTEEWCRRILEKNFPNVPITNDVKELANDPERLVPDHDILSCGYPCQPFSVAGLRKGEKDDRHILPFLFKIIACKRPTWVVCENVYGHVALGLDKVLADLESEGYSTRTFIVPACAKDAPHRRDRLWIIARLVGDTSSNGRNEIGADKNQRSTFGQSEEGGMQEPSGRSSSVYSRTTIMADSERGGRGRNGDLGETQGSSQSDATQFDSFGGISSRPDIVADSESERHRGGSSEERGDEQRIVFTSEQEGSSVGSEAEGRSSSCGEDVADSDSKRGCGRNTQGQDAEDVRQSPRSQGLDTRRMEIWTVEPNVGRVAHGIPRRVDRLKGLGNAIVPQISMQIGLAIKEEIKENG